MSSGVDGKSKEFLQWKQTHRAAVAVVGGTEHEV